MKKYISLISCMVVMAVSIHAQQTITLQQLYNLADQQCQQILISEYGLKAANEAVESAKSTMLPSVSLSASGSYIGNATLMTRSFSTSGTTDVILAGLGPQAIANGNQETPHWGNTFTAQASQVIYAGGGIKAGIKMAEIGQQMAALDVEKNRQEVRFLLVGYYLDLYRLQIQTEVINKNIELTQQVINNMRANEQQGTALKNDITRYVFQLKSLELTRVKLQDAIAIINHQLCNTLNLDKGTIIIPDTSMLNAECQSLGAAASQDIWQQIATDNHVGLKQAKLASELAEQKIQISRAASLPSVALVGEDNFFGPYTNDLIPVNANVNAWFVGVGIKYNLSSIWNNNHQMRKAQYESDQAKMQYTLACQGVNNGVQACYVNFLTAYTEVETQEKQVELADQNFSVVRNRYENQLALLTDMLDASNMKLSADMALVSARISLLYNFYKLKYTTNTL